MPTPSHLLEHLLFVRNLVDARKVYDNDEREGWKRALGAIVRYLNETEAAPELLFMFFSLRIALQELEQGVIHDALKPKRVPHRSKDSTEKWTAKAYAAAALELLMHGGLMQEEAARLVARRVTAWPQLKGVAVGHRTIINWREDVSARSASEDVAKRIFDTHVRLGLDHGSLEVAEFYLTYGPPFGRSKTS